MEKLGMKPREEDIGGRPHRVVRKEDRLARSAEKRKERFPEPVSAAFGLPYGINPHVLKEVREGECPRGESFSRTEVRMKHMRAFMDAVSENVHGRSRVREINASEPDRFAVRARSA